MRIFFVCLLFFCALIVAAAAKKNCKKNKLRVKIKVYYRQCLDRGYKSKVGCVPNTKKKNKFSKKNCRKMERRLITCNFSCKEGEEVSGLIVHPVEGGWSEFGGWSKCRESCGGGTQTRTRTCTNPAPAYGGKLCEGGETSTQKCNIDPCPVEGGWSEFGGWSKCTESCGGGTQTRTRTCTNPAPAYGGKLCEGGETSTQKCNMSPCEGRPAPWVIPLAGVEKRPPQYGPWSACSVSCGGGTQYRRACTAKRCVGVRAYQVQHCNTHPCRPAHRICHGYRCSNKLKLIGK